MTRFFAATLSQRDRARIHKVRSDENFTACGIWFDSRFTTITETDREVSCRNCQRIDRWCHDAEITRMAEALIAKHS